MIHWERTGPILFPVKHPKDSVFRLTWEFVMDASENCDEGSREKTKAGVRAS